MRIYAKRRTLTPSQTARSIVESLPMIGPKTAKALLIHFGSVEALLQASEREIAEVHGVGKKRAKMMRAVLSYAYKEEDDRSIYLIFILSVRYPHAHPMRQPHDRPRHPDGDFSFLSHAHSDHTGGLRRKRSILASPATLDLAGIPADVASAEGARLLDAGHILEQSS